MQKNKLFILAACIISFSANAQENKGTVAIVNGEKISLAEVKEAYKNNPQVNGKVSFDEFYPKALDVFVNGKVLFQAAVKDNISSDPAYKKQVELAKEEVARRIYLEKRVAAVANDEAVTKLYNDYKTSFKPEQEVKAKHILVDSEAKAKEVIAKLKKGEKFDALAKQYSKEPAELGYFTKNMMVPEFGEAAFAMKKGEYSQKPVKTKFGYHVILVEDAKNTKLLSKKEAEPQLKALLTQNAIGNVFGDLYKNAKIQKFDQNGKPITQ